MGDGSERRADESPAGYEFNELENKKFKRLAGAMQFVAAFEVVAALLAVTLAAPAALDGYRQGRVLATLLPIAAVAVPLFTGLWTWRAGAYFRLIVGTEGNDISHLMGAMGELTKLYLLQIWLFFLAIVFIVGSLLLHGGHRMLLQ